MKKGTKGRGPVCHMVRVGKMVKERRLRSRASSNRCGEKSDRESEQHEAAECVDRCVYRIGHWKITRNPVVPRPLIAGIHFRPASRPKEMVSSEGRGASVPRSRSRCRPKACRLSPAGFPLAFVGSGNLLALAFRPMALRRRRRNRPRKSGSPPLLEPSFKFQRDDAHNLRLPGSRSPPVSKALTLAVL
jgi:hypothetical protein